MKVLVTGGAGYIGSHTCVVLLEAGHEVVVPENLSNASATAILRMQDLVGRKVRFHRGDVRRAADLDPAFEHGIDPVIPFAALNAVAVSDIDPLRSLDHDVGGTIALLQAKLRHGVRWSIFSSSATVFRAAEQLPVSEDTPVRAINRYGRTKLVMWFADPRRAERELGWRAQCDLESRCADTWRWHES